MISAQNPTQLDSLCADLEIWCAARQLPIDRVYGKLLAEKEQERSAPVLLRGDPGLSPLTTTRENGVHFGLDFSAGYSAGFFIDQRANRSEWRGRPAKRLLNCFAYTCSFSVVAALAGSETVSVDLSKKSLDRGRANFELNEIDAKAHRFIADDVLGVLPYLKRRGEKFDGIVLDPPTFSRGAKGKVFRAEKDFGTLFDLALDVAAPNARILLSTNCTRLYTENLEDIARDMLQGRGLRAEFHPGASLPDIPASNMPTTVWVEMGA